MYYHNNCEGELYLITRIILSFYPTYDIIEKYVLFVFIMDLLLYCVIPCYCYCIEIKVQL